ncbi:MAG: ABC transporter ATP-binding protein [Clostridium sp.]
MNLLTINNVMMNYHSQKGETEAIKEVSFHVNENEFVSILGPSGCGKSTLLNIISGLIKPSQGEIFYRGEDIHKNLDKIGYMFQKDHLFDWATVWQNVILGLKIKHTATKENLDRVDKLLKDYDLYKFKNHYPTELSGGMRQRVALIRTLALNPEILFLDEPFSALDYQTRLNVCDEVYSIIKHEKKTALMVTHDIAEAISTSKRILVLSKRPSIIQRELDIDFDNKDLTPFKKRSEKEFVPYFNILWKELNEDDK